jgi:uncharacterized short protein YbdD (DUF466 family)
MSPPDSPPAEGRLARVLRAVRTALAWLNGDTAYARHVEHWQRDHPGTPPPSRATFHRLETERRWNGVRRCC